MIFFSAEGQMIFISGPVVVLPSETITFHVFLPNENFSNMKWWKTKDQSKGEVETGSGKYSVIKQGDNIYRFEIVNAEKEDGAAYQCTVDNMKSNTINVYVDGKYIHPGNTYAIYVNLLKCAKSANGFFHFAKSLTFFQCGLSSTFKFICIF